MKEISELESLVNRIIGRSAEATMHEKIVAIVEYRDGTIIDVVRQAML